MVQQLNVQRKINSNLIINDQKLNNKKTNKTFAILSAIGIIMVVSSHVGNNIDLFTNFFPYGSFFMPMFMFISGYFFKDKNVENLKNLGAYIKKKAIYLLLYYFVWNVIYGIIGKIMNIIGLSTMPIKINWKTLFIFPFINGQQFSYNNPAWFIPTLFTVEMTFLILRKLQLLLKHHTEYLSFAITLLISMISVVLMQRYYAVIWLAPFLKLGFFLFFFQLGKLYKDKWEEKEMKIKNIYMILTTITINIICIKLYKDINLRTFIWNKSCIWKFTTLGTNNNFYNWNFVLA